MSKTNGLRTEQTEPGDIVIIKDEDMPRNQWRLARVDKAYADEDGLVRKVKLVVGDKGLDAKGKRVAGQSYLERPVHKLVLLLENPEVTDAEEITMA